MATHVQRAIPHPGDAAAAPGSGDHHNGLHALLFQPIAGDSSVGMDCLDNCFIKGLQFGILDVETIRQISVTNVTNTSCAESPHCLSDLRMGASAVTHRPCETCKATHHNCSGHFGRITLPHPAVNPLFVGLVTSVLQTICVNCCRLRLSPYFINTLFPPTGRNNVMRVLQRLKSIAAFCARQTNCQFCQARLLTFRQQGIGIVTRPAGPVPSARMPNNGGGAVLVPAHLIFALLTRIPDIDINALGFVGIHNHPCNAILSLLPVMPPVSRPSMRTLNLKNGQPFVVEARCPL